jgi:DNA repair ATPase RecN
MSNVKEEFKKYASKYAEAMEEVFEKNNNKVDRNRNQRIINQMIFKLKEIYKKAYFDDELKEIEEFMFHKNKYIRSIAATYSLISNSELAVKVLNDLIELPKPNWVAPDARLSLESWKKGYLNPENM